MFFSFLCSLVAIRSDFSDFQFWVVKFKWKSLLGCSVKHEVATLTFTWLPCFRDQSVDDYNFYHAIGSEPSQWEKSLNKLSSIRLVKHQLQLSKEFYTRLLDKKQNTSFSHSGWIDLASTSSFAGTRILIVNIPKVYKRGTDKRSVLILTQGWCVLKVWAEPPRTIECLPSSFWIACVYTDKFSPSVFAFNTETETEAFWKRSTGFESMRFYHQHFSLPAVLKQRFRTFCDDNSPTNIQFKVLAQ